MLTSDGTGWRKEYVADVVKSLLITLVGAGLLAASVVATIIANNDNPGGPEWQPDGGVFGIAICLLIGLSLFGGGVTYIVVTIKEYSEEWARRREHFAEWARRRDNDNTPATRAKGD